MNMDMIDMCGKYLAFLTVVANFGSWWDFVIGKTVDGVLGTVVCFWLPC